MAQLDDVVGSGDEEVNGCSTGNTIIGFTTTTAAETSHCPTGAMTPFARARNVMEGGFRAPMIVAGRARCRRQSRRTGSCRSRLVSDAGAAAQPNRGRTQDGQQLGDRSYKVYLDGLQPMEMLTGAGKSKRSEIFYFAETTLGAVRRRLQVPVSSTSRTAGCGAATVKVDWPMPRQPPSGSLRAHGAQRVRWPSTTGRLRVLALPCSSSRRWRNIAQPPSWNFHPCRRARASTWSGLKEELEKRLEARPGN